jgi:hypothetical protein
MTEAQEKHREKRQALKELSKIAKIRMSMDCEGSTVNEILINEFYTDESNQDFKTLNQWSKEGYKVKKGSKAFLVWGRPKAKQTEEPKAEDEEEDEFFPLCYLFSNAQVEKR